MRSYKIPTLPKGVTFYIIVVTAASFLLQTLSDLFFRIDYFAFFGSKINQLILFGQIWRFITPILFHGSLLHLVFNMYALYSIGPELENRFGKWPFLALYLIGGLWGNVFSFLLTPNPSLGASTAIFGLIAAQGVYIYKNRHLLGSAAQRMLMNIGMIVLVNLALGLSPGVDNWGHIGGLLGGLFFSWFASPTYGIVEDIFGSRIVVNSENRTILVIIASVAAAALLALAKFFLPGLV